MTFGRFSLKRANAKIDFGNDELNISGESIPIVEFQSGHMAVSLLTRDPKQFIKQVLFSCPLQSDDDQGNERKIVKIHKQFAHAKPDRLYSSLSNR